MHSSRRPCNTVPDPIMARLFEHPQGGRKRAAYGEVGLARLGKDLTVGLAVDFALSQ